MAAATTTVTGPGSMNLLRLLTSYEVQLGAAGWCFFIAENVILSENRTYLIEVLGGDEKYHTVYGTISTLATASIGYSYYKLQKSVRKSALPSFFSTMVPPPLGNRLVAWTFVSTGLLLASQALPKMQIPFAVVSAPPDSCVSSNNKNKIPGQEPPLSPQQESSSGKYQLQVRCPFDFADKKKPGAVASGDGENGSAIHGLERVSRHAGLWSFGLIGAGNAALQSNPAMRMWWMGPAAVAWLGGMHTDSRFRRGMGGTLDPMVDSQTSNIPFLAMLTGKQGSPTAALANLVHETKLLNAAIALGVATLWVVSRGRIP